MSKNKDHKPATRLMHTGYDPSDFYGLVNMPPSRTSTILYPSLAAYENPAHQYRYGRLNTPTAQAFSDALCELENGVGAIPASSGLAAISTAFFGCSSAGDHILVADSIYPCTRDFLDDVLSRMGVEIEYYDPYIGAEIAELVKDNTSIIYMESPGSATYCVQDVPAIVKVAKAKGITTMLDNSWSSGVLFNPLEHGVDLSILSCTKYINGHSDGMLGAIIAGNEDAYKRVKSAALDIGVCAGSEEIYAGMRGLKTLNIRMKEAGERGLEIANWLQSRGDVHKVYHPALETHKGHDVWKRDFKGTNGLVSILLNPAPKEKVTAFVESLELFRIGSSWGGYESLLQPQYLKKQRSAVPWTEEGFLIRLNVGFEHMEDLKADLDQAFEKLKA
ncbi:MAG: cystathionine beta-lyase [Alphaproteobacteria bacterium]|nr:cystathionine beta-lyase [Alphaproteobacteria bacterium]